MSIERKSGEVIKRLRNEVKMSQGEFAAALGITSGQPYISQLENNKVGISLNLFMRWLEILEVESFDLCENIFDKYK